MDLVHSSNIFQARMLKFGMDILHPYLRNVNKSHGLQPFYGGLGAKPPPAINRVKIREGFMLVYIL